MSKQELNAEDLVVDWLDRTREQLKKIARLPLPLGHVLTNGKVERELKFLMAATWEVERVGRGACLMEKGWFGCLLDLIALEREPNVRTAALPKCWIETKCDFSELAGDGTRIAEGALDQIGMYFEKLRTPTEEDDDFRQQLMNCDRYIVHFINHTPTNEDKILPDIMTRKFETTQKALAPIALDNLYASTKSTFKATTKVGKKWPKAFDKQSRLIYDASKVVHISESPNPIIDAVVVKLRLNTEKLGDFCGSDTFIE